MPRYIDADKKIHIQTFDNEHEEFIMLELTIAECLDSYADEGCPEAADVVERKKGTWINDDGLYRCSSCGKLWAHWWASAMPPERLYKEMKYCPRCGAEMREEKTDERTYMA